MIAKYAQRIRDGIHVVFSDGSGIVFKSDRELAGFIRSEVTDAEERILKAMVLRKAVARIGSEAIMAGNIVLGDEVKPEVLAG